MTFMRLGQYDFILARRLSTESTHSSPFYLRSVLIHLDLVYGATVIMLSRNNQIVVPLRA